MNKQWRDINLAEYNQCRVSGYIGGATWLALDKEGIYLIIGGKTPIEIRRYLEDNPTETIRAESLPDRKKG